MKNILPAEELQQRLKKIKLLLLDVDGVLTDGTIFYSFFGWTRRYHTQDGFGIRTLLKQGFPVGVISGGKSLEMKKRMKLLGIKHYVLGSEDKLSSMNEISKKLGIEKENICFVGDDTFDIPALKEVGLAATVPNALDEVKEIAHLITQKPGGQGAAREVIDAIRRAQNLK